MEGHHVDDSSHYEISLTAGQAFIAFVLLLFSLAAAFAFGVIVGKGQFDDSMAAAAAAAEKPAREEARIADLGSSIAEREVPITPTNPPVIVEEPLPAKPQPTAAETPSPRPDDATETAPHFAQLLSTGDAKAAEELAAKLIEAGFSAAYVERSSSPRGMVHRVRVRFPSEAEARASVDKLKRFASGEIWVARQ